MRSNMMIVMQLAEIQQLAEISLRVLYILVSIYFISSNEYLFSCWILVIKLKIKKLIEISTVQKVWLVEVYRAIVKEMSKNACTK